MCPNIIYPSSLLACRNIATLLIVLEIIIHTSKYASSQWLQILYCMLDSIGLLYNISSVAVENNDLPVSGQNP